MADEKQVFSLDLDIKEFTENALKAKGSITEIGDPSNLAGLAKGLFEATASIAVLGVAALALKTTFDLVFDGEQIQKTNALFESLSKNAGIVGENLKEGLVKSAGGLATTTEILQVANKALISMGESAKKLPEIMDLARKYTQAFGGELVENFDRLSFAISTGSQKALKQMGIVVDITKAERDYAHSLHASVEELSESGRRQAILNAVLSQGKEAFKDVTDNQQSAINSYQQLKTSIKDLTEVFIVLFEKTLGPMVRSFISSWANFTALFKDKIMIEFGDESEKASNQIALVKDSMKSLKITIDELEKESQGKTFWTRIFGPSEEAQKELEVRKEQYKKFHEQLEDLEKAQSEKHDKLEQEQADKDKGREQETAINKEKYAKDELKLREEIMHMKEANNRRSIELATTEAELDKALAEEKVLIEQDAALKKLQVEQDFADGKIHTREEANEREILIEEEKNQRIMQMEYEKDSQLERMNENYLKHSQNTADGIGRAFEVSARRAETSLKHFGDTGMMIANVIQKRGADAFMAFGKAAVDHSQTASEIMKSFFINALADIAEAQGKLYLAAGLVDPTKLAAGAALLAISGALRAMAGSAGAGGGGGDYGGGGGSAYGTTDYGALGVQSPQQQEKKSVTIQVQGHYFETEQTKTRLMELVRDATDATDFKYQQIGGQ